MALLNRPPASAVGQSKSTRHDIFVGKGKGISQPSLKVKKPVHKSQLKDLRAFFVSSSQCKISLAEERSTHPTVSRSGATAGSEQNCTESVDVEDIADSRTEFDRANDVAEGNTPDADAFDSQGSYIAGSGITDGSEEGLYNSQSQVEADCRRSGEIDLEQLTQLEGIRAVEEAKTANATWSQIKEKMSRAVPLCKGHDEPCVARVVKKGGPNIGRGFYVCARAEVGRTAHDFAFNLLLAICPFPTLFDHTVMF